MLQLQHPPVRHMELLLMLLMARFVWRTLQAGAPVPARHWLQRPLAAPAVNVFQCVRLVMFSCDGHRQQAQTCRLDMPQPGGVVSVLGLLMQHDVLARRCRAMMCVALINVTWN